MQMKYMRRLAALGTALMVLAGAAAAGAAGPDARRWAPMPDMEDGAIASEAEPVMPVGAMWVPWEGLKAQPAVPAAEEKKPASPQAAQTPAVAIKAPSAVLLEARSGRVLYEKNSHERRNPASVTKIMTLIVAFDALRDGKVKMEDKVTISDEAAKQVGTIIFADTGETFSLAELLKSVAVGSANDAAVAVAEHVAGSAETFVQAMNNKAKALGMHDTQFQNPTGLSDEGHFTSAYDIALMSRYAALNYPELMKLTAVYGDELKVPWRKNGPVFKLWNNNKLLTWYTGADGLKTGWTQAAGYCLAATAVRGDVRMISVIMGADNPKLRNAEAAKLLDFGFSNYTAVELAPMNKKLGVVSVTQGKLPGVDAVPQALFAVSVAKGEQAKVKMQVTLKKKVEAPVEAGQVLGEMIATMDGKEIARMPLVAAQAVPKANVWESLLQNMKSVFTID